MQFPIKQKQIGNRHYGAKRLRRAVAAGLQTGVNLLLPAPGEKLCHKVSFGKRLPARYRNPAPRLVVKGPILEYDRKYLAGRHALPKQPQRLAWAHIRALTACNAFAKIHLMLFLRESMNVLRADLFARAA